MNNWTPLEHAIWKNLATCGLEKSERFLIAVSGGCDSMTMLNILLNLKPKAQIKVVHYHHGTSADGAILNFRNECFELVSNYVKNLNNPSVHFFGSKSVDSLVSEDDFRQARWAYINGLKEDADILVTAHHLDDRLETVLLKLIRGSSLEGVSSFQMWNGVVFRPLLNINKTELVEYAKKKSVLWIEDPSNKNTHYLRNWVRESWLEQLEEKLPGARANLAKSLFKVIESTHLSQTLEQQLEANSSQNSIARQWFFLLPRNDQLRVLALFLKRHKIYEFSAGQLEEIRKRLDKNQKELTFEMLGLKWFINASQIVIQLI